MSSYYTEGKPHTDGTLPSFSGKPWSPNSELGDYVKTDPVWARRDIGRQSPAGEP